MPDFEMNEDSWLDGYWEDRLSGGDPIEEFGDEFIELEPDEWDEDEDDEF